MRVFSLFQLMLSSLFCFSVAYGQDVDLSQLMESEKPKDAKAESIEGTFYATRIINGQSIEHLSSGILDLRISHRFGQINEGLYSLFGLDNASMRMGVDYGVTDNLMVGLGRSTFQKQVDAFFKYRILSQTVNNSMPVSMSFSSTIMLNTLKWENPNRKNYFGSRLYYAHQLLIARKFTSATSLQIMPTLVHYNLVKTTADPSDLLSIGIGGRQRLSKRVSLNAEYYYQLPNSRFPNTRNSLSLGLDIETGGHVFQLHVTNSRGMTERTFINETIGKWDKGDLLFGFNISRVFSLKRK